MRIAICDDDGQELARLSELMTQYQLSHRINLECCLFHNGIDFLCDMKGGEYDLILLDPLMKGIGGMQAVRELREQDKNVKLIFISSSSEFAIESYSVEAYHYLLKPISADSLFPLLDKDRSEVSVQEEQGFVLKNRDGIIRVAFARLEYVEVINKTVSFHLAGGEICEVTAALTDFEGKLLSRPEFLKTHRSYLINLNYVQKMGVNGIVTRNGHTIPVSRQRRSQIQEAYLDFLHQTEFSVPASEVPEGGLSEGLDHSDQPWRILLVDDAAVERTFWADILRCHGCMVQLAGDGEDALKLAAEDSYDCVLLDVMIPGEDGFSICGRLHRVTNTPVIFLSCLTESDQQMRGFAAGGIDYITKDTSPELFWTKVETRIRLAMSGRTRFCYGPLLLDLSDRRVMMDGKELLLTSIEFDILWRLSEHAGYIFSPEEIFGMVFPGQIWDGGQMVQSHVSRLRKKLERAWGQHHFIEAVWGQGYRFVPVNY